jgi:hypothetical protein
MIIFSLLSARRHRFVCFTVSSLHMKQSSLNSLSPLIGDASIRTKCQTALQHSQDLISHILLTSIRNLYTEYTALLFKFRSDLNLGATDFKQGLTILL